jgi:hypothetical protein
MTYFNKCTTGCEKVFLDTNHDFRNALQNPSTRVEYIYTIMYGISNFRRLPLEMHSVEKVFQRL